MLALCVTCRPAWQPWLLHELAKQEHDHQLIVFDDCSTPLTWPERTVVVRRENRLRMTLGEKRQAVLCLAEPLNEPFAWFDDDDWHPNARLAVGASLLAYENACDGTKIDVIGYHAGIFVDVKTLQTRRLETGDSVTFNGAVFAPHCAKQRFEPMNRGEDTMWLRSVLKDSTVVSSPVMQHAWMSHDGNVTGKRGSMSFEGARFSRFDSWELEFLRSIK